jgi:hypothetical protein
LFFPPSLPSVELQFAIGPRPPAPAGKEFLRTVRVMGGNGRYHTGETGGE